MASNIMLKFLGNFQFVAKQRSCLLLTPSCNARTSPAADFEVPPRPKRPLPTFIKYVMENREVILKKEPKLSHTDVVKRLSELWKNLDPDTKLEMKTVYDAERKNYAIQMQKYNSSLTAEQKEKLKTLRKSIKEEKEKQRVATEKRMKSKVLEKPKKPPNSFLLFLSKTHPEVKRTKGFVTKMAGKWLQMSNEEKKEYISQSLKLITTYKNNLKDWEEKMMKEGNKDLVRKKSLKAQ